MLTTGPLSMRSIMGLNTCSKSRASTKVISVTFIACVFFLVSNYLLFAEVERQLQGAMMGSSGVSCSGSPRLSSKKSALVASQSVPATQSHSRSGTGGNNVMTSRSNNSVQMRRATNTKGKPVPAPPKRTRYATCFQFKKKLPNVTVKIKHTPPVNGR